MESEQYYEHFDEMPPEKFLTENSKMVEKHKLYEMPNIINRFHGDKSKEFYLGMASASRVLISLLEQIPDNKELLYDYTLTMGSYSAYLASKK